jgi:5'-3' exonuclease
MILRTYIDGNSVGFAASARKGKKLVAGSQETTAIYGALGTIRKMLEGAVTKPVVLWDGRSWRYDRFPEYKSNRTKTAEQVEERERYKAQKQHIVRGLHYLGIPQLIAGNMEADDLAAIMTRRALAKGDSVILASGDKDWIQLVEKGVVWDDHKVDRKCTVSNFEAMTGFRTQRAFVHAKALQGDSGDNVLPRTGIGEAGAVDLLKAFDDVHHLQRISQEEAVARWEAVGGTCPRAKKGQPTLLPTKYQALRDDPAVQARFEWALELMDLSHPSIPAPKNMRATRADVDLPAFKTFCAELSFSSILRDAEAWAKPFTQIQEVTA